MDIETIEQKLKWSLIGTATIAAAAVAFYFIWFGLWLDEPLSKSTGTWGELGDFVGGLMNPIVAGCALYWLAMSVRLQKQELGATREELTLTRNELAASRRAQEEQVKMALIAGQINSLSLRLTALSTGQGHVEARLNYVLEQMDQRGVFHHVHEENGKTRPINQVASTLRARLTYIDARQKEIISELELLQTAASETTSATAA